MPTPTRTHRGAWPPGRRSRPLAALALAAALPLAAADPAPVVAATGNPAQPEFAQIREDGDRIGSVSACNVMVVGAIALAAIAWVLIYAGRQRKARERALAGLDGCKAAERLVADAAQDAAVAGGRNGEIEPQVANAIIENAAESISVTDASGVILQVNGAYCRLTGYTPEEAIGKTQRILKSGRHDRRFYEAMWRALLTEGRWEGKIWNRRKDGSLFLENLVIVALRDAAGTSTHYVGISTDLTHKGLDQAQIDQLAFYDPLTGLATRALLIDHLCEAARQSERTGRRVAVFYINLDDFSTINAEHGHAVGDALLKAYAERLESIVRGVDTVARPGGDEFALILRDIATVQDVPRIAEKLLHRLAAPLDHNGQGFALRASVGISLYPDHGEQLEQLAGLAKQAMSQAKAAGKGRWIMHQNEDDRAPPQATAGRNPQEPTTP
jgi:diguanylate cyclase (GGDEF)-like protein/PAS domain S-box-containing protein